MKSKKKTRKRKKNMNSIAAIAVLVAVIVFAVFVVIKNEADRRMTQSPTANVYFYDTITNGLKPEARSITAETNAEKAGFVLEELSMGPKSSNLSASVRPELIKAARITGGNVDVELTGDYYELSSGEEIIGRAAIVLTLSELPFVETVSFNVEGSPLLKPNEQPLGKIKAGNIVAVPNINPQGEIPRTLTLYFAGENENELVTETHTILVNPNESAAKFIIQELIRGPQTEGLLATVPPETKLLDISVTDGVCSVDLSREFTARVMGGTGFERLTIFSVVNSLSEQSDIKSVQFLIEGKRQEQFRNETGFNNLYEAVDIPPVEEAEEEL